jgi:hypothetical protein
MASNNQNDDWQEVPAQPHAADDWQEVNDWQETAAAPKMKSGMEAGTYPVADAVQRAMGYAGNVTTTALLAGLKRLVSEGQGLKDGGDLMAAIKGQGKSAPAVLQESFGMSKVPSWLIGLPLEATADPVSHIPGLVNSKTGENVLNAIGNLRGKTDLVEKVRGAVSRYLRPVANKMDDAGRGFYRNTFRKVDADAAKFKGMNEVGEHPFSDLAYDKEFLKGGQSPLEMEQSAASYRDDVLGPQYNEIIDSPQVAAQRGTLTGSISPGTKAFLRDAATRSLDRPGAMAVASTINRDAQIARTPLGRATFDKGQRSPRQMLDLAKSYSDTARGTQGLPGDIMKRGANESSYKQGLMNFAQDLREKVQELAEKALPGSREKIQDLNSQYQILKSAEKPMLNASMVEARKLPVTQADSVLGGMGLFEALKHGDPTVAGMFTMKRLGKYLNSPSGGVRAGNTLKAASKSSAWDAILRNGILDKANEKEGQ